MGRDYHSNLGLIPLSPPAAHPSHPTFVQVFMLLTDSIPGMEAVYVLLLVCIFLESLNKMVKLRL